MKDNKALYTYNPATDNFERFYPSWKSRLSQWSMILLTGLIVGSGLFALVYFGFFNRSERELREENTRLRTQYHVLERHVQNSMKVMEQIRKRDDNFYRVMLQMEPMSLSRRYAGFDYERNVGEMNSMSDYALVETLSRNLNLLDRQLYSQSQSFDQLRRNVADQREKMDHIPGIIPLRDVEYTISSGFGQRRDPVSGTRKLHEGIDFYIAEGTPVYATADGKVCVAGRTGGFGNSVEILHGYNYTTRYAHLSEVLVKEGDNIRRGDLIGKVGSSGKSLKPHLHYEVLFKGTPENPVNYFYLDLTPDSYASMLQTCEDAGEVLD